VAENATLGDKKTALRGRMWAVALSVTYLDEFLADLPVFIGPLFDEVEFGLSVFVSNRNRVLGHHLRLAF
jgi:hypothetical protein